MMRYLCCVFLLFVAACTTEGGLDAFPTVTASTIILPSLPAASEIPPSPDPIQLSIRVLDDDSRLPADSRTQLGLEVVVFAPEREVEMIGFQLEGGGEIEPSQAVVDEYGIARATYTTGESSATSTVRISAIYDSPDGQRYSASTSIELVRDNVSLSLPCGFLADAHLQSNELSLRMETEDSSLGGLYLLRFALTGDGALLGGESPNFYSTVVNPSTLVVSYQTPDNSAMGESLLCADLPERRSLGTSCRPLVWSDTAAEIDARFPVSALWGLSQATLPDLRLQVLNNNGQALWRLGLWGYEVLAIEANAPSQDVMRFVGESRTQANNICRSIETSSEGLVYSAFISERLTYVARMQVLFQGEGEILRAEHELIVAAYRLAPSQRSLRFQQNEQQGEISFEANLEDLRLYAVDPLNVNIPNTEILLKLYLPAISIQLSNQAYIEGELRALADTHNRGQIIFRELVAPLEIAYLSPEMLLIDGETYQAAYLFLSLETADLIFQAETP